MNNLFICLQQVCRSRCITKHFSGVLVLLLCWLWMLCWYRGYMSCYFTSYLILFALGWTGMRIRPQPETANVVCLLPTSASAPSSILLSASLFDWSPPGLLGPTPLPLTSGCPSQSNFRNRCLFHSVHVSYPAPSSSFDLYRQVCCTNDSVELSVGNGENPEDTARAPA